MFRLCRAELLVCLSIAAAICAAACDSPPAPASLRASVKPLRALYQTDQVISLEAVVVNSAGAEIEGAEVTWSASPTTTVSAVEGGQATLLDIGRTRLTACTVALTATGEPACDSVELLVDDGSPQLELTAPLPGAELGGDGVTGIAVTGSVVDARETRVYVNGQPIEVDDLGRFATEVAPVFGINHVDVVATDGLSVDSLIELDVLWANGYEPAASDAGVPAATFEDGVLLQLGQSFFDDEVPLAFDGPIETRDLADILELVVANVDFASSLPDPVIDEQPTFFLRVPDVRAGAIEATLDVTDTGADLFLRIAQLDADTEGSLDLGGDPLDLAGGISASLSVYAQLSIAKPGADEAIAATLEELTLAIESAEPRFDSDEANAVFRLAEGALRTTLEELLLDVVSETLASALPAVLTSALGALDTALRDQQFDLDTGVFPALTVNFDGRIASLATVARRHLRAALRTSVRTDSAARFPDSRGLPQLASPVGDPLFASRPVQLAVRADLLNGLLHGLWNSGMLEFDASEIIPESFAGVVTAAFVDGRLPPVLRPARGAESYDLILELGQLELDLVALDERTLFGVSLSAGVNVDVADNAIALDIAEEPVVRVWVIASEADSPRFTDEALSLLIERLLWEELRNAVADSLSIQLPTLDVGDLESIAPALAGFELAFELENPLDMRDGFAVFDVGLVGRLPEPTTAQPPARSNPDR